MTTLLYVYLVLTFTLASYKYYRSAYAGRQADSIVLLCEAALWPLDTALFIGAFFIGLPFELVKAIRRGVKKQRPGIQL